MLEVIDLGAWFAVLLAFVGTIIWSRGSRRLEYRPRISILWYVILLHTVWGITLLFSPAPLNITAIHTMLDLRLVSPEGAAARYLSASLLAIMALFMPPRTAILFLIPQHVLLAVGAYGATVAIIAGRFADGVVRDSAFLLTDQSPAIIMYVLHIVILINLFTQFLRRTGIVIHA